MFAELPKDDVVVILVEQHREIRRRFDELQTAAGASRRTQLDDLRVVLAVHEAAEEVVLRPVTGDVVGQSVADARNHEERDAQQLLEKLDKLDGNDKDFDATLSALRDAVLDHVEKEESEEFAVLVEKCDPAQREALGRRVRMAEAVAPTRPHPSVAGMGLSQRVAFPFAAIADRVRDALGR